jgi:hypothetical protein
MCIAILMAQSLYVATFVWAAKPVPKWKSYTGAWFKISYPPGFKVCPSLKSLTTDGYDSAFFKSPDGKVEFYIFSPQWNGEPNDIALNSKTEKIITTKTSEVDNDMDHRKVIWTTIKAKDGSYQRSLEDTADETARWVFGIKYVDAKALKSYADMYRKFKKSLVQYAD